MAPSKSSVLSFLVPLLLAFAVIRPPLVEDYLKQVIDSVQTASANISSQQVTEKFVQFAYNPSFKFAVVYALLALLTYLAVKLYKACTEPLAIYCDESKVAYFVDGPHGGKTKEEQVKDFKRARSVGDVPPVYPNGWMAVLMSSELKKKEQKFVHVAGKNLAVFRGESGRVFIVDAYCAHLGANLAIGGSVHGDCIECPFHGWRYRGEDGKCVKIGYAEKVPEFAKIPTYHSCEVNHRIFFWHHAEGNAPDWEVPVIPEINDGTLKSCGFTVCEFDSHNEDTPENGADIAHLDYLHGPRAFRGRAHFTDADWSPHPTEEHIATVRMCGGGEGQKLFGLFSMPKSKFEIDQIGPCFAHFKMDSPVLGRLVLVLAVTPVGPMRQRIVTTGFCKGGPISFYIGKYALYEQYYQLEGDIVVWANKKYMRNPLLVKEDHLIAKHRRFFSKFYSENSPKHQHSENSLDW